MAIRKRKTPVSAKTITNHARAILAAMDRVEQRPMCMPGRGDSHFDASSLV
jgi:hypothetical protein